MDNLHGDLRGIIEHLDYVHSLGIDVLYMTPIFKSNSSHKYDTIDYYQIDPSFGTAEDLKELVQKAHEYGMKVVMDAVFNHTGKGRDSKLQMLWLLWWNAKIKSEKS